MHGLTRCGVFTVRALAVAVALAVTISVVAVWARVAHAQTDELKLTRAVLEDRWRVRIQGFLDQGKLPLIDMESSLEQAQVDEFVPGVLDTFDELAIAVMVADGYQREKDGSQGYRWSNYILDLVNAHPDAFAPVANGGTNPNWLAEKGGKAKDFIDQMEAHIRTGTFASMGEFDFLHYMSSSQCKNNRTDRDSSIPLNGENGHRLFKLAAETGVPFSIHLEPEDRALDALEEMLASYPKAKVIIAHFGQIRHPEVQTRFTPAYVRHLLSTYPNLWYDLATGEPNRTYKCAGANNSDVLKGDTVLWKGSPGLQTAELHPDYKDILSTFSDRFVFATDYGGGRKALPAYLREKHENFMRIIKDLPIEAQHDIAYRNAWRLLTGRAWGG